MNPKARQDRRRTAAFTLMEGLICVAIMGTVFVALYTGMASGFKSIRDAQENVRATQILIEKLETVRLYNWDQINQPGFVPSTFTAKFAPNANGGQGITYNGRITVLPASATEIYNTDLRAVRIELFWKSGSVQRARTFTTYVAKYGIQNYVY